MSKRRTLIMLSIVMGIVIGIFVTLGTWLSYNGYLVNAESTDLRPKHCMEGVCVPSSVFRELPEYPSNFQSVWNMLYPEPFYGITENFSVRYPDENYYKQPEFYADTFQRSGIEYYTVKNIKWRAGAGGYPSEQYVTGVDVGETIENIAYYHASWAIPYYQMFKLVPSFPEHSTLRMGEIEVYQNPTEAERCLEVSVEPKNIILEPTWPYFYYNWAQKIKVRTTVKCVGEWVVSMGATDADADVIREYVRALGRSNITTSRAVGEWIIYINSLE